MPEIIPISSENPAPDLISYAANSIRRGEVIAIPTDTLYCLIADPFNLAAVEKVFETKSRAWDRSLPLIVESIDQAQELAKDLPSQFYLLARRYWPGQVSIIVRAAASVPLKVTGNTGRVAVRQPAAPIPSKILASFGMPLIATSANVSGHPTSSTAGQVVEAMGEHLSLVLDSPISGDLDVATTIDITKPKWRLIREGAVSEAELREILGD